MFGLSIIFSQSALDTFAKKEPKKEPFTRPRLSLGLKYLDEKTEEPEESAPPPVLSKTDVEVIKKDIPKKTGAPELSAYDPIALFSLITLYEMSLRPTIRDFERAQKDALELGKLLDKIHDKKKQQQYLSDLNNWIIEEIKRDVLADDEEVLVTMLMARHKLN